MNCRSLFLKNKTFVVSYAKAPHVPSPTKQLFLCALPGLLALMACVAFQNPTNSLHHACLLVSSFALSRTLAIL